MIAGICRGVGILAYSERRNRGSWTMLCYHRVLPAERKPHYFQRDLVVTAGAFKRHCRTLRERYDVLPLSAAIDARARTNGTGRPIAVITFDDGYWDNAAFAAPILAEFGLPATFFVVAGFVGKPAALWFDRLGRAYDALLRADLVSEGWSTVARSGLDRETVESLSAGRSAGELVSRAKSLTAEQRGRLLESLSAAAGLPGDAWQDDRLMDWQQLAALIDAGHEIGAHGMTHEILTRLDDRTLESEVRESRRVIEQQLGVTVQSFCYPNGDVDDRVARAVQSAGYRAAVSVATGVNEPVCDPYRLKRWFINEDRLAWPGGRASDTLLRMEICSLAERVFARRRRRRLRAM